MVRLIQIFGIATSALTIFLFPDGRFVPSWTRPFTFGLGIWLTALLVFPEVTSAFGGANALAPIQNAFRFVAWLFGTDIADDFTVFIIPWGRYIDVDKAKCTVSGWQCPTDNSIPPQVKIMGHYAGNAVAKSDAVEKVLKKYESILNANF